MDPSGLTAIAPLIVVGLTVVGLLVGSFLNVVIHRVPRGESIVRPGSACPGCATPIRAHDNVPVVSWLVLRGRCRACGAAISPRYPLVEAANAALWAALSWWCLLAGGPASLLPLLLIVSSACLALALIDLDVHRLPNAIVYPLYPVTVAGLALAGVISGEWHVVGALVGAAIWTVTTGLLHIATRGRGMGLGDVKLSPVLGAIVGWIGVGASASGLLAAFVLGGLVAVALLLVGRARRGTALAFGPFLILGAALGLTTGPALVAWYLGTTGVVPVA